MELDEALEARDIKEEGNTVLQEVGRLISPAIMGSLFKAFLPAAAPTPSTAAERSPFHGIFSRFAS